MLQCESSFKDKSRAERQKLDRGKDWKEYIGCQKQKEIVHNLGNKSVKVKMKKMCQRLTGTKF